MTIYTLAAIFLAVGAAIHYIHWRPHDMAAMDNHRNGDVR